jgi:hypothetical protein
MTTLKTSVSGGPPGPSFLRLHRKAGEGVGCGPGGLPYFA